MENVFTPKYEEYTAFVAGELIEGKAAKRTSLEKLAASFGIDNKNLIKELTELGIVRTARQIAMSDGLLFEEKFKRIVEIYNNQANLSMRTSQSILLQQYSTPAPISYIASCYIKACENSIYFEPSAGNGLLTIALPPSNVYVNEIDDVRLMNLNTQPFAAITRRNAILPFPDYYKKFDGVITNPPFGTLGEKIIYDTFPIVTLDHLMALRALDCMKDTGKAAIIIGGHTTWDEKGSIQAGKNRIFFNYLYSHYHVQDVINIDGHKLYSRQGTAFNVRLILINGRKAFPDKNYAPLYDASHDVIIYDFDKLFKRVFNKEQDKIITLKQKIALEKNKLLEL